MGRRFLTILALAPLALSPDIAAAQPSDAEADPPARSAANSSDNQSGDGRVSPAFQLIANVEGETTAQLTLGFSQDASAGFGENVFGITLSAPINESTDEGALITQRGIPGGFSATVSHSATIGQGPDFSGGQDPATGPVRDWLLITNLSASIGFDEFDFRDPVTFAEDERRETSYALSGSLGYLTRSNRTFIAGGVEYRRRHKARDEQIFCRPATPGDPVECIQAVFAPPEEQEEFNLFGTFRTLLNTGIERGLPLALEIRATYDANNDVFGVEAPIYFLLGGDGGLRGGIRVGWDSDEDDVRGSVFIGVPFNLIRM